jgi:hypothetical protein
VKLQFLRVQVLHAYKFIHTFDVCHITHPYQGTLWLELHCVHEDRGDNSPGEKRKNQHETNQYNGENSLYKALPNRLEYTIRLSQRHAYLAFSHALYFLYHITVNISKPNG